MSKNYLLILIVFSNISLSNQQNSLDNNSRIFAIDVQQLKHRQIPNKTFFICFSGTPGMGKTYIAKILEDTYKAVRINTDEIRKIIKSLDNEFTENSVETYLYYFLKNYSSPNRFFILDASIDRRY